MNYLDWSFLLLSCSTYSAYSLFFAFILPTKQIMKKNNTNLLIKLRITPPVVEILIMNYWLTFRLKLYAIVSTKVVSLMQFPLTHRPLVPHQFTHDLIEQNKSLSGHVIAPLELLIVVSPVPQITTESATYISTPLTVH